MSAQKLSNPAPTMERPPPPPNPPRATESQSPQNLIALAIQQGADVEKLERLMALSERWNAKQAEAAYYRARSEFQASCPVINKSKTVEFNKTKYKYAPLDEIVETIREPLRATGLSFRWEFNPTTEGGLTVTCIVTHVQGHSERNPMSAEPDDSGAKNRIQQLGSTAQYLQRYTLIGALGITSADTDDDGRSAGELNVETMLRHNGFLREFFFSVHAIKSALIDSNWSAAAEAWCELDTETKRGLWLAPTKGGIFTTKEREQLKSPEFSAACKEFGSVGDTL